MLYLKQPCLYGNKARTNQVQVQHSLDTRIPVLKVIQFESPLYSKMIADNIQIHLFFSLSLNNERTPFLFIYLFFDKKILLSTYAVIQLFCIFLILASVLYLESLKSRSFLLSRYYNPRALRGGGNFFPFIQSLLPFNIFFQINVPV